MNYDEIKEIEDNLEFLYNLDIKYRGKFIFAAIFIERIIEDVISYILYPDKNDEAKRNKVIYFILSELSFAKKIMILERLLKSNYQGLFDKYNKIIDDVEEIRSFRNLLAHSELDTSVEFLRKGYKDRIQLKVRKKDKIELKPIKIEDIERKLKLCDEIMNNLGRIKAMIIVS